MAQIFSDSMLWMHTLCFTGHRPEKLPQGEELDALLNTLHYYIDHAIILGFRHFYTGLADGIDFLAADYLFRLRSENPALSVTGVQPCRNYPELYRDMGYDMTHLDIMLRYTDRIHVMPYDRYDKDIFRERNRYMVDNSAAIIAVCADGRSGSMQTLRYAQQKHLAYCRIFPSAQPPYPAPAEWPVETEGF